MVPVNQAGYMCKILDSSSDLCNVICSMLPFRSNPKLDLTLLLFGLFFTHCLLQDFTEVAFLEEMLLSSNTVSKSFTPLLFLPVISGI